MASAYVFALLPAALAGLSAYTLYHSYNSIQNVRAYEDPAERAAKYSNIAEDQLSQTRTTEGAGAVAVRRLLSIVAPQHFPCFISSSYQSYCVSESLPNLYLTLDCRLTHLVPYTRHHTHLLVYSALRLAFTFTRHVPGSWSCQCCSMFRSTKAHCWLLEEQGKGAICEEVQ